MKRSRNLVVFILLSLAGVPSHASVEELILKAHERNVAQDSYWLRLLHYKRGVFGGMKSDIDGNNFFLSKDGRHDPTAELDATLRAFYDPIPASSDTQHPQCRYPARFAWLNERLQFGTDMPRTRCERFESWEQKMEPESLSIVFAGYYLNNPASMYGHTFLRVGRATHRGSEKPLLDYTINFAANTPTRNGIVFAAMGLAGGYPGTFTALPYYMKVQQYNNLESRDLWEYQLNFSSASVHRLLAHVWELGPTSISYYFLNKNCSYQLLPLLEVADPKLNLSGQFHFRAIPIDTLRTVIEQPQIVSKRVFRPSALRRMIASRDVLTHDERAVAQKFPESDLSRYSAPEQRRILDASYDYLRYKYGYKRNQSNDMREREQKILLAMNKLPKDPAIAPSINIAEPAPPESSHRTGRIGLAFGATRDTTFEEISARGALHDFESSQNGFVEGSQLEMLSFRARWNNENGHATVEDFTAISVLSMTPREEWVKKPSWHLKINYGHAHDLGKSPDGDGYAGVGGGSGASVRVPILRGGIAYAMVDVDSGVGGVFRDYYRLGAGGSTGVVLGVTKIWRAHFIGSYIRYGIGDISSANRLRLVQAVELPKDFELRLTLNRENYYRDGIFSLNRYF